jgi:hypothetical protein
MDRNNSLFSFQVAREQSFALIINSRNWALLWNLHAGLFCMRNIEVKRATTMIMIIVMMIAIFQFSSLLFMFCVNSYKANY